MGRPSSKTRETPKKANREGNVVVRYHHATRGPAPAALMVVPLFLLYGLGLLVASPGAHSGADFVSEALLDNLSRETYIGIQLTAAALILGIVAYRLKRDLWKRALLLGPVVAESAAYALVMGTIIIAIIEEVHLLGPTGASQGFIDRTVVSAGAGLHEELVFRLALVPLLVLLLHRGLAMPMAMAIVVAIVGSSVLFALAHHLSGEPIEGYAIVYRTLAGCIFATLLITRGFAVAAWTHASYDFYVLGL